MLTKITLLYCIFSKLLIAQIALVWILTKFDLQFNLPMGRCGPLVVCFCLLAPSSSKICHDAFWFCQGSINKYPRDGACSSSALVRGSGSRYSQTQVRTPRWFSQDKSDSPLFPGQTGLDKWRVSTSTKNRFYVIAVLPHYSCFIKINLYTLYYLNL